MGVVFKIHGQATAFARAGSFGKRRFTPPKQSAYKYIVQQCAIGAMQLQGRDTPFDGALKATVRVFYQYPSSWSGKRKLKTLWKVSRPDADNLAKIVLDALNGIVFADDAQVVELIVKKQYGELSETIITIEEIG
jgi:Holliday junction resolvase RusA-like endonuclease